MSLFHEVSIARKTVAYPSFWVILTVLFPNFFIPCLFGSLSLFLEFRPVIDHQLFHRVLIITIENINCDGCIVILKIIGLHTLNRWTVQYVSTELYRNKIVIKVNRIDLLSAQNMASSLLFVHMSHIFEKNLNS